MERLHLTRSVPLTTRHIKTCNNASQRTVTKFSLTCDIPCVYLAIVMEKIRLKYGRPFEGMSGPSGFLQAPGSKFYDIGCGIGKTVVAAAILHNFDICVGVEILKGLHDTALQVAEAYNIKGKSRLPREFDTEVRMVNGDLLARDALSRHSHDWTDGDIVFVNSVSFDDEILRQISDIALGMRRGTFIISVCSRLPAADFTVVDCELLQNSWGYAKVYIMQKNTDPRFPDSSGLVIEGEVEE